MIRALLRAAEAKSDKSNRFAVLSSAFLPTSLCIYESPSKSEHFHIPITLTGRQKSKEVVAMIDSGASTLFIHQKFVKEHNIHTYKLKSPIPVFNIDGTPNQAGVITDMAVLTMKLGDHEERAVFTVTDIGPENVIIGIDWLRYHNPSIDWYEGIVVMDRCPDSCKVRLNLTPFNQVSQIKAVLPKLPVKRSKPKLKRLPARPVIPLEPDIEEDDDEPIQVAAQPTRFDPIHLAALQSTPTVEKIGG